MSIEFEQGRLIIQERKPRFAFDAKIFAQEGLQVAYLLEFIQLRHDTRFAVLSGQCVSSFLEPMTTYSTIDVFLLFSSAL